jgi:hypothetical protein
MDRGRGSWFVVLMSKSKSEARNWGAQYFVSFRPNFPPSSSFSTFQPFSNHFQLVSLVKWKRRERMIVNSSKKYKACQPLSRKKGRKEVLVLFAPTLSVFSNLSSYCRNEGKWKSFSVSSLKLIEN